MSQIGFFRKQILRQTCRDRMFIEECFLWSSPVGEWGNENWKGVRWTVRQQRQSCQPVPTVRSWTHKSLPWVSLALEHRGWGFCVALIKCISSVSYVISVKCQEDFFSTVAVSKICMYWYKGARVAKIFKKENK